MFEDEIIGSLDELTISSKEKNQFIRFCKEFIEQLEKIKGTASTTRMKIEDNLYEQYELIKKRKKTEQSTIDRVSKKVDAINVQTHLREKLKEEFIDGKIHTHHIQDFLKTRLDEELGKLDSNTQEEILEKIKDNRNKLCQHNSEEIASFVVRSSNYTLTSINYWYQGILESLCRVRSFSNPCDACIEELDANRKERLTRDIDDTINVLNLLSSRIINLR